MSIERERYIQHSYSVFLYHSSSSIYQHIAQNPCRTNASVHPAPFPSLDELNVNLWQVDQRHLGLVADHMTFNGSYRPLNRAGMADFSSPCLQMSFETTAEFMTKAAVSGSSDRLKSPSARIVVGRVGDYGTGMFELRQPT